MPLTSIYSQKLFTKGNNNFFLINIFGSLKNFSYICNGVKRDLIPLTKKQCFEIYMYSISINLQFKRSS